MKSKNRIFGIGSLLGATFIYSFGGILARMIGFDLPLFYQGWTRNLICAMILIFPIIIFKKWQPIKTKDFKWMFFRALGGFFGFFGSFLAFLYLSIGTVYFIFYGGFMIASFILGKVMFGEKLTKIKIISLILSIFGLLLIYSFSFESSKFLYLLCALVSGFGTAVWNTFSKKISDKYSAMELNFVDFLLFAILTFILSIIFLEHWVVPDLSSAWIGNYFFIFSFLICAQLVVYGFNHLDVHTGSLIMLIEVVFAIILGYIFYHETLSTMTIFGGLLIILAVILPELRSLKKYR